MLATNCRYPFDRCTFRDCNISTDRSAEGFPRPALFVIPSSDSLVEAKSKLMIRSAIGGRRATQIVVLDDKLGFVRQLFDYTVIDCPPTLDIFSDAVYKLADEAIVPIKTDVLGEVDTAHHTGDILSAQAYGIDIKIACILPIFFDRRLTIARFVLDTLEKHYGKAAIANPIPRFIADITQQRAVEPLMIGRDVGAQQRFSLFCLVQRPSIVTLTMMDTGRHGEKATQHIRIVLGVGDAPRSNQVSAASNSPISRRWRPNTRASNGLRYPIGRLRSRLCDARTRLPGGAPYWKMPIPARSSTSHRRLNCYYICCRN
jgi:hypothetical protein